MSRIRFTVLAAFLLAAFILATSVRTADVAPSGPYRAYLPALLGVDPPASYWGVQPYPDWKVAEPAVGSLLQTTHVGWMRMSLRWKDVEPQNTTPDKFTWAPYEQYFAEAARRSIQLIVTLDDAPPWAADLERGPLKPGMLPEYLEFVQAAVERFSQPTFSVRVWEIYNEPDGIPAANSVYVGAWGEDPYGFTALLKATYPVIKRIHPNASVMISLSYDWFTDQGGLFVRDWLDQVIDPARGNAGAYFDVYGLHMYTFFRASWEPYGRDIIGKTNYLRALMAKYGVQKPMMVTEMGEAGATFSTPEQQGRYAIKGTVRALSAGHQVVLWFTLFDFDTTWRRGLFNDDNTPRPAAIASRTMTQELRDPAYVAEIRSRVVVDPDVEGYYFRTLAGETLVIWVDNETDPGLTRTVRIPAAALRTVDRTGTVVTLKDADDGKADGVVTLQITTEPRFVRVVAAP